MSAKGSNLCFPSSSSSQSIILINKCESDWKKVVFEEGCVRQHTTTTTTMTAGVMNIDSWTRIKIKSEVGAGPIAQPAATCPAPDIAMKFSKLSVKSGQNRAMVIVCIGEPHCGVPATDALRLLSHRTGTNQATVWSVVAVRLSKVAVSLLHHVGSLFNFFFFLYFLWLNLIWAF